MQFAALISTAYVSFAKTIFSCQKLQINIAF